MNKKNPITVIAVVFVVLALGTTVLGISFQTPHSHDHVHEHDHQASSSEAAANDEQEYTCSMHPNFRSTDPNDRCPICGMELVPVTSSSARDDDVVAIELSGRSLALLSLQTFVVEKGSATAQLRLIGSLDFDERALTTISAWTSGRIERLHVNYSGAQVEAGAPLVELYSPELLIAQQELLQAQRQANREAPAFLAESNQTTLRAARERLRLLGLSSSQIEQVIARGEASDRIEIHAPSSGLVVTRNVSQGDYVNTGDTLLELADAERMWAVFELFERDLAYIEVGQTLTFSLTSSEQPIEGVVESLSPRLDADSRTRQVRVAIQNAGGNLTAGALLRAQVEVEVDDVITIPASAPLLTGKRAVVYVRTSPDSGEFEARQVEIGRRLGEYYEVLSGLEEGELVVSRGAFRIDSELQLRGRPSMMAPQGGGGGGHDHGGMSHADMADEPAAGHAATHEDIEVPVGEDLELSELSQAYFAMWEALHSDDLDAWQAAAESFFEAVEAVQWPADMHDLHSLLATGAGHAHHVTSLDQAREQFQAHSQAMIALARAGYVARDSYLMFCPMAFDNQGAYWLQPDRRLLNPYFGDAMLRCGDRVERFEGGHDSHGGH